jgi:hypothetical protein
MVRCMLCAGPHKTEEHQCDVVGCKSKKGQNCNHNINKCANCKGGHIAKSNECPRKRDAIGRAREERTSWRDCSRIRTNEVAGDQQQWKEKEEGREDGAISTGEGEKKVGESQTLNKGKKKESEVQKEVIQTAPEESISETQW